MRSHSRVKLLIVSHLRLEDFLLRYLGRRLLFAPIAGIGFAPVFDTLAVFRSAEVVLVLWTLLPAALTLRFTLLAAYRLGAVALVTHITMIRRIKITAAEALALGRTLHRPTQKFEPPSLQDQSKISRSRPNKIRGRKKQNEKVRTKWIKVVC